MLRRRSLQATTLAVAGAALLLGPACSDGGTPTGPSGSDGTAVDATDAVGGDGGGGADGAAGDDGSALEDGVSDASGGDVPAGDGGGGPGEDGVDEDGGDEDGASTDEDGGCSDACGGRDAMGCQDGAVVRCEDADGDGCLEWRELTSCGGDTVCEDGQCVPPCEDGCPGPEERRCQDGSVEVCGDTDEDSCLEWSVSTTCGGVTVCEDGQCVLDCEQECTEEGVRQCGPDGAGYQVCGDQNGDGCLTWGEVQSCSGDQVCSNGECAAECSDACSEVGATQCEGSSGYEVCEDHDGDGCLEWDGGDSCPDGEVCSNGECAESCADECAEVDDTRCTAAGVQTCDDYNGDGCLQWGTAVPCGGSLTCSNGQCTESCTDACPESGATQCSEGGVQTCEDVDDDGCLEWGTAMACEPGQSCSNGACQIACTDACPEAGATQCDGDAVQTCGDQDDDACLEWSEPDACGSGEICEGGECVSSCSDACPETGASQCASGGVQTCLDVDGDGCLEWSEAAPCDSGETCEGGECVPSCTDACPSAGSTQCAGGGECCTANDGSGCSANPDCADAVCEVDSYCCETAWDEQCADCAAGGETVVGSCPEDTASICGCGSGVRTCSDHDGDSCLEWGGPEPCGEGQACEGGECVASCSDACASSGATQCDPDGGGVETCGDHDGDACLEWSEPEACETGESCEGGECTFECADLCEESGATQCDVSGDGVETCGNHDDDECLEWSDSEACPSGETCEGGECVSTCTDTCSEGAMQCNSDGSGVESCSDHDGDGCLEWGGGMSCGSGETCEGGECVPSCTDDCSPEGATTCASDGEAVETCGDHDGDVCLEWSEPEACGDAEQCVDGACEPDPCAGVTCDDPPADECVDGSTLRTYEASGSCSDGDCSYPHEDQTCAYGCEAGACVQSEEVVISEVVYDSEGSDTEVFVEIHGPAGESVGGFSLVGINGNGGDAYGEIALEGSFDENGLFTVADPDGSSTLTSAADQLDESANYQNGPDSIQLRSDGQTLDALGYGEFDADEVFAGEGEPAPDASGGAALARDGEYTDTDDNATDFALKEVPTPGKPNDTSNALPSASLDCPAQGFVGESLTFDASGSSDPDGSIVDYAFEFGDGSDPVSGSSATAEHTYASADTYEVQVTVEDDGGLAASASCEVTIEPEDMIVTEDVELCGTHEIPGEFAVQGGATVTCPEGELTVYAESIFVDPASTIDLSGTNDSATDEAWTGERWNACDIRDDGFTGAGGGGGNGDSGSSSQQLEYWDYYTSGTTNCDQCYGAGGGEQRGWLYKLAVFPGGSGGNGCDTPNEYADNGYCSQDDILEGGTGGGVVRLYGDQSATVQGSILADGTPGEDPDGTPEVGAGGGAGGAVLLAAPEVSLPDSGELSAEGGDGTSAEVNNGCDDADEENDLDFPSGGHGGDGRVEILHGGSFDGSGTIVGVSSITFLPPLEVSSSTHPDLERVYNDTFDSFELEWTAPFSDVGGYWYLVDTSRSTELTPENGTFTAEPTLTKPGDFFSADGTWYVHLLSSHSNGETGVVSNTFTLKVNDDPPGISSDSHPDQDTWYASDKTALTMAWSPPEGMSSEDVAAYWYRVDRSSELPPGKEAEGWTRTTNAQALITEDWQGEPISGWTYYVHVAAEDELGNLTPTASHFRVQIGEEPDTSSFFGNVSGPDGSALQGATVEMEPYGLEATTDSNGYFNFEDVYHGSYTVTVSHDDHGEVQKQVEVGTTQTPWEVTLDP